MKNMTIMKQFIICVGLVLASSALFSQTAKGFQWIQHHGDVFQNFPEWAKDIQPDQAGNVYVAGEVNPIFVRDSNGVPIQSIQYFPFDSLANHGGKDIWLAKYDAQGNLLWHRYAGGGDDDRYFDMKTDPNGNIYISGRVFFNNTRPAHSFNRSPLNNDEVGTFIAKVSASGNLIWHKSFGGDTISGGSYIEYPATIYDMQIESSGIRVFFIGGGNLPVGFQKLYDKDSLNLNVHEALFNLNGNYISAKTFDFPNYNRLPDISNVQSNANGYIIAGTRIQDSLLVGNDTIIGSGNDNAVVLAFDTNLTHIYSFYSTNEFDQFPDAKLYGDSLIVGGHFFMFNSRTVNYDTISHQGSANANQEVGLFTFNIDGTLLGFIPSKSLGNHTSGVASAYIDKNTMGIGGAFNHQMTFSGGSSYMEAVSKCTNCTNTDVFFALFNRDGTFITEDVIYSSNFQGNGVLAMAVKDSMVYIGGIISDTVIVAGVDTFVTVGANDAFVAAYNLGFVTSLNEPSGYIKADNGLLAYPNPTNGQFTIMGKAVNKEAQLFNISGQLVKTIRLNKNVFNQSFDVSELTNGVYFLIVTDGERKQQIKLVKQ